MSDGNGNGNGNGVKTGRGRPRQPFCPDCIKAGKPGVPKRKGSGYCSECHSRRIKVYRNGIEGIEGTGDGGDGGEGSGGAVAVEDSTVRILRAENAELRRKLKESDMVTLAYHNLIKRIQDGELIEAGEDHTASAKQARRQKKQIERLEAVRDDLYRYARALKAGHEATPPPEWDALAIIVK